MTPFRLLIARLLLQKLDYYPLLNENKKIKKKIKIFEKNYYFQFRELPFLQN